MQENIRFPAVKNKPWILCKLHKNTFLIFSACDSLLSEQSERKKRTKRKNIFSQKSDISLCSFTIKRTQKKDVKTHGKRKTV